MYYCNFRLSYHFGGDYNPPWFHVPNIMLHGIVSVLLLRVFSILFGGYTADLDSEKVIFVAPKSALLCALLFSIHPVHTEAVSPYIMNRVDSGHYFCFHFHLKQNTLAF